MHSTPPTLQDIRTAFDELGTAPERLEYLVELGGTLPGFPAAARVEANRVQGCQSRTWLVARELPGQPPRWEFLADSDAPMARGLVAILLAAYSGRTAAEILRFPVERLFEELKLTTVLSPLRSNGLFSMVRLVRDLAGRGAAGKPAPGHGEAPPASTRHAPAPATSLADAEVAALRADFPILGASLGDGGRLVYLDNAATTQRPRAVIEAMAEAYGTYYANVHRGGHELSARTTERYEAARESCRRLLGARHAHEIVFTPGTTAGINCVARAWGDAHVRAGDEVLLSVMEHHSNIVPWQQLAERTGCRLRFAPVTDEGHLDREGFRRLLGPRTRIVAITAVSNVLGTVNPVRDLVREAHDAGATVLVDAAQAVPHGAIDVVDWGADFVVFSGHKLAGPSGVGVLHGREDVLEAMPPFLGGGGMIDRVTLDGHVPARLPAKFEAGTPPIVPAIGLAAAIEYLERIGLERIAAHERRLTHHAHRRLADLPDVRILGPGPDEKAGIVTFVVDGLPADDVARALDARGVAIRAGHHCAMPLHERLGIDSSSRASFWLYNSPADVDRLVETLGEAIRMYRR